MTEKKKRGPKQKVLDNELVAQYLINRKWNDLLCQHTKQMLPAFVDDAVWAAIYICAGTHKGKVNISPKLVFRALMLSEISTESVQALHIFDEKMSVRKARLICQCARFAIDAITARVREEEEKEEMQPDNFVNWKLEKQFVEAYYSGVDHKFYTALNMTPKEITGLYNTGRISEYKVELREWKLNELRQEYIRDS